jgi:hypothetical protein
MEKFLLLKPVLTMISQGKFFTKVFTWFLKLLACLILIGFLFGSYRIWYPLSFGFEAKIFFANLFMQILFIALVYGIVNILWFRSVDIDALPQSTDYVVIPVCVIFVKMIGEILAVFYTLGGLAAALATWIAGGVPLAIPGLSALMGGGGFAGGLTTLIGGPIIGFLLLSLFYFIAEQIGVFVDIARNTRR